MKRRDFIKSVAIGSAVAAASRATHAAAGCYSRPMLLDPRRTKTVFISDLHMNADYASSWLKENATFLADFLVTLNTRSDVAELVILGDMLDQWITATDDPPPTFGAIISAEHNLEIVEALQALCTNPAIRVSYVTGNHDLLSWQGDNPLVIADTFPGMTIYSQNPGIGEYTRDNILWAEHGHRYTLFNAPDIWSHSGSHLPLGFFISRLVASLSQDTGMIYTTPDVLELLSRQTIATLNQGRALEQRYPMSPAVKGNFDDALIVAIFNAIARFSGKTSQDEFVMNALDGFDPDPSVAEVSDTYATILSDWPVNQNRVAKEMALWNELGYMINTANLLFKMPSSLKPYYPFTPRIVLFGHTHKALLSYSPLQRTIYANTGTWIDGKPMTWVEVDIRDVWPCKRSYGVSLWQYGSSAPKQTASILSPR